MKYGNFGKIRASASHFALDLAHLSIQDPQDKEAIVRAAQVDQAIFECVRKVFTEYAGGQRLFLYNYRKRRVLREPEIPSKPEELEECLDHLFDGASVIVKKAIVAELTSRFQLPQDCNDLKHTFELARKNSRVGSNGSIL
jgi:hypothetical protein